VIDHLARVDLKARTRCPSSRSCWRWRSIPRCGPRCPELGVISPRASTPSADTFPWVKPPVRGLRPRPPIVGDGLPGVTRTENGRPTLQQELDLVRKEIPFFTQADREKIFGRNAAKLWDSRSRNREGGLVF